LSSQPNSIQTIEPSSDEDEPPPTLCSLTLDDIFLVFNGLEDTEEFHKRGHISVEKHANSIEISLRPIISEKGWYMAFKIYPDGHVADNKVFIRDTGGMNGYYENVRAKIKELGLGPFHNPFVDYTNERWEQYKKEQGFFPYNPE